MTTPIRHTTGTLAPLSNSELYALCMDILGSRPKSPNPSYLRRQILEGQARLDAERAELAEQLLGSERQVLRAAAGGGTVDELEALLAASDERAAAFEAAGGNPAPVIAQVAVEAGVRDFDPEEWAAGAPEAGPEREYSEAELAEAAAVDQQATDHDLVAHGTGSAGDLPWSRPNEKQALGRMVRVSTPTRIVIDDPCADEPMAPVPLPLPPVPEGALLIIGRVHEDDLIAAELGEEAPRLAAQARATVDAFLKARGAKTLGKLDVDALRELYPLAVGRDHPRPRATRPGRPRGETPGPRALGDGRARRPGAPPAHAGGPAPRRGDRPARAAPRHGAPHRGRHGRGVAGARLPQPDRLPAQRHRRGPRARRAAGRRRPGARRGGLSPVRQPTSGPLRRAALVVQTGDRQRSGAPLDRSRAAVYAARLGGAS